MKPWRITIHCSATPDRMQYDISKIKRFHTDPPPKGRGWKDIGYHAVIQPDGSIQNGRPFTEEGAGVVGDNQGNLQFCLVGTERYTTAQFNALRSLIDSAISLFEIKPWNIFTHNQFPSCWKQGKTCPGMPASHVLYWYWSKDFGAIEEYLK